MKKITDTGRRFAKTLFQSLVAAAIVLTICVVIITMKNLYTFDFANVYTWVIFVCVILATGFIAGFISLIQNSMTNHKAKHAAEKSMKKRGVK